MTDYNRCHDCNRTETHRHCEKCGAYVSFPPFHCGDCNRILCGNCEKKGCCGKVPAEEGLKVPSNGV